MQQIRVSLSILHDLRKVSYDEFVANPLFTGTAERHFQVAIQSALDIGQYLLSNLMVKQPSDYSDVFVKLGEVGIVPANFVSRLVDMAKFRNVLVHLYLEVDSRKVYQYIQGNLDDFEAFAGYVADFVRKYEAGELR